MGSHFVYALVEGMDVKYVGYTARPEQRRQAHARKHPDWRMLTVGSYPTRESGLEHEEWWIDRLRNKGEPLTNIREGGLGRPPDLVVSHLTRAKLSAANRARVVTPETRAKISASLLGNHRSLGHVVTAEERAEMSASRQGHAVSAETRAKMSAAQKGRVFSPEARARMSAASRRRWDSRKAHQ